MAANVWSSLGDTNGNTVTNWSLGALNTTDTLTFDATSVIACTFSGAIACTAVSMAAGYTGLMTDGGQTFTVSGAIDFSSGGAITLSGTWTQTGDANFTITCSGTVTVTGLILDIQGTCTMEIHKVIYTGYVASLTCAYSGKTITYNAHAMYGSTCFTFNLLHLAGGIFNTVNGGAYGSVKIIPKSLNFLTLDAGTTISGNANFYITCNLNTPATINIPAFSAVGTVGLQLDFAGDASMPNKAITCDIQGTISILGTFQIYSRGDTIANSFTINTNNNTISSGNYTIGTLTLANARLNINCGSSIRSFNTFSSSDTGRTSVDLSTSQNTCTGNYTLSIYSLTPGTSLLNLTGTAAQTITSNGKSFYDITINRSTAGTLLFADATSIHTLTVSATNTQAISWTGTTMTAGGNLTIDGSSTLNCGTGITATGASGIMHFGSGLGAVTASACTLTMNGTTGMTLDDDKGITTSPLKALILGASAIVTSSGAGITTVSGSATPITTGANSTLTLNQAIIILASASITVFSFGAGTTVNGTGAVTVAPGDNSLTLTIPAVTYTGSGAWSMYCGPGSYTPTTFTLSGALNLGTANFSVYANTAGKNVTFNPAGYAVTCGALAWGSGNTGTFALTASASAFTITSYVNTYDSALGTSTIALSTATFTCAGSWTVGGNHTISGTAASQTVTITNTATITSNGKVFPGSFIVNASGKTITLADAISTGYGLTVAAGTFTTATFAVTCSQNFSINGTSTYTGTGTLLTVTGNYTLAAGVTYTPGTSLTLNATSGTQLVTTSGKILAAIIQNGTGGTVQLQDALTCTTITLTNGSFDQNTQNIVCTALTWNSSGAGNSINGAITCSGSVTLGAASAGSAAGSTITITNTATITSNGKIFGSMVLNGSGKTFTLADNLSIGGNLTVTAGTLAGSFSTTVAGNLTVSVSTTFNRLIMTKATTRTITIGAGATLALTNLTDTNLNGSTGAQTQWRSSSPGSVVYLTIPAPITLIYQNPQDVSASQKITSTVGSTDGDRNVNWDFGGAPTATVIASRAMDLSLALSL